MGLFNWVGVTTRFSGLDVARLIFGTTELSLGNAARNSTDVDISLGSMSEVMLVAK
jgi:hypothetical protein